MCSVMGVAVASIMTLFTSFCLQWHKNMQFLIASYEERKEPFETRMNLTDFIRNVIYGLNPIDGSNDNKSNR